MTLFSKSFWILAAAAVIFKVALFIFVAVTDPSNINENDSPHYLSCASTLVDGFRGDDTSKTYNILRTPGYPFFLAVFHNLLGIPLLGIVILQILLSVAAAWIVSRTAALLDSRLAPLSALIILFDFPTTIFSMMILTEALYLFLMSLVLWWGVLYLQNRRPIWLILAVLTAAAGAYVRPAGYFLPFLVAALPLLTGRSISWRSRIVLVLTLSILACALLFAWHWRNYKAVGKFAFSSIGNATLHTHGLIGRYGRGDVSGKVDAESMHPVVYYVYTAGRHTIDLMTEPGSLKYFDSKPLKRIGKVFGYVVVLIWLPGWIFGIFYIGRKTELWFLLAVTGYFMAVTILSVGWETTPRFRVPMMPFIAILSAFGWRAMADRFEKSAPETQRRNFPSGKT